MSMGLSQVKDMVMVNIEHCYKQKYESVICIFFNSILYI